MFAIIFYLLLALAFIVALAILLMLILWLFGADSIALPGLGLLIATPLFIILLIVIELFLVVAAMFVSRWR